MKRIFAALLATIMILSIVPVSPVIALDAPTFSVSDGKGSAGEQVTLSVNIRMQLDIMLEHGQVTKSDIGILA